MENTEINTPAAQIDKLAEALSKAQGKIKAPIKNCKVDFTHNGQRTKYSYADLADVIESLRGPLSENGLAVVHRMVNDYGVYGMVTELLHLSGQRISTWYPLPNPGDIKPQAFGSAITYARRYSISSLIGIASENDDDGATAEAPKPSVRPASTPPKGAVVTGKNEAPALKTHAKQIASLASDRGITGEVLNLFITNCYPGMNSQNMKRWQAEDIVGLLEDKGTNEATLMSAVSRAQTEALSNQATQ